MPCTVVFSVARVEPRQELQLQLTSNTFWEPAHSQTINKGETNTSTAALTSIQHLILLPLLSFRRGAHKAAQHEGLHYLCQLQDSLASSEMKSKNVRLIKIEVASRL